MSMSSLRFKFFRDISVFRLWSVWTRRLFAGSMVKRCRRDSGVREVFKCFRQTFRPKRTLLLSATAAYTRSEDSSCDQGIGDDELEALLLELEKVQHLVKLTLYCTGCGRRLAVDRKLTGVTYCACKEPQVEESSDGWVPYIEAEDVIVWRKEYKPGQGLYAYKVYGRYPEVTARDFAAVQVDGAYRRAWDAAVAALAVVQRRARGVPDQAVLHWEVLWPRMFANRDYVYIRRHKEFDVTTRRPKTKQTDQFEGSVHAKAKRKAMENYARERDRYIPSESISNKVFVIISRACEHPRVPESKHAIRVMEYWSHMVVKTLDGDDKAGMEFVLTYYDEPAVGGMPCGVAAWASGRAATAYLGRMRRAALDYRAWTARELNQELPDFVPFGPDLDRTEEMQLSEQDMETCKQGPELENGDSSHDKSTQTDASDVRDDVTQTSDVTSAVVKTEHKSQDDSGKNDDSQTPEGEESGKEEEKNGGWWRYLYPFYYFV